MNISIIEVRWWVLNTICQIGLNLFLGDFGDISLLVEGYSQGQSEVHPLEIIREKHEIPRVVSLTRPVELVILKHLKQRSLVDSYVIVPVLPKRYSELDLTLLEEGLHVGDPLSEVVGHFRLVDLDNFHHIFDKTIVLVLLARKREIIVVSRILCIVFAVSRQWRILKVILVFA
jgi:hypothetical protein